MSAQYTQYQEVRVARLLREPSHYNGWGFNQRPPLVGDIGTIVDILQAAGLKGNYVVECSGPNGVSIWLGEFIAEELEST